MTAATPKAPDEKTYAEQHPEQDPAEGSDEVIEHDLETENGKGPGAPKEGGGGDAA